METLGKCSNSGLPAKCIPLATLRACNVCLNCIGRQTRRPICAKVLGATNATALREQTGETGAAQPLKVYAAHAKQRGLLAPQQKGLVAAHVGVKLFLTN